MIAVSRGSPAEEIFPPEFLRERFGTEDPAEALERAQKRKSTTPRSARRRCPSCGSVKYREKVGYDPSHQREGAYRCQNGDCGAHFDEPAEPSSDRPHGHGERFRRDRDEVSHDGDSDRTGDNSAETPTFPPIMSHEMKTETETYRFPTGGELEELREALDLSRADLEAVKAAAPSTHRATERGERSPRLREVRALLAFYHTVDHHRRAERLAGALNDAVEDLEVDDGEDEEDEEADAFVWTASEDLAAPETRRQAEVAE